MLERLPDFPSQRPTEAISSRKHGEEILPMPAPEETETAAKISQTVVTTSASKKIRKENIKKPKKSQLKDSKASGSEGKAGFHASTHALQNTTPFALENKRNEEYSSDDNNTQRSYLQDDCSGCYSIQPHTKEVPQPIHHTTTEDAGSSPNQNLDAQLSNDNMGWTIVSRSKKQTSPSVSKDPNKKQMDLNRLRPEPARSRFRGNSSDFGLATEWRTPRSTPSRSNRQTVNNMTTPTSNSPLMIVDTDFPPLPSPATGGKGPVGKKSESHKELKGQECEAIQNMVLAIDTKVNFEASREEENTNRETIQNMVLAIDTTVSFEAAREEETTSCEPEKSESGKSSCENEPPPQTPEAYKENVTETMCIEDKESSSIALPLVEDESSNVEQKQTSQDEEKSTGNNQDVEKILSHRPGPWQILKLELYHSGSPLNQQGLSKPTLSQLFRYIRPANHLEAFFGNLTALDFLAPWTVAKRDAIRGMHLYADIKFHWSRCGEKTFRHPCRESTIPWDQIEGPPLLPNRFNWDTPERHRQAVYHATNRSGDYFIFADWAEFLGAGQPVDDLAVRCSSEVVAVVRIRDPAEKDKLRRVLGLCLFAAPEVFNLVYFLFRLVRDGLRSQGEWTDGLDLALRYQMEREFAVLLHPGATGLRHACETEWSGRNVRHCVDSLCWAESRPHLVAVGIRPSFRQTCDLMESSYWLLRAARITHPTVIQVAARTRGEGFDVPPRERRLFRRGEGWDGVGTGVMEVEGLNVFLAM
ncbi:hypothetical protein Egran_02883 [Elaphomyces granulatus]|uniref:Uncharacterized protein n=1 Tax=Elaphomyces granulatus TaxID=519963 RepID=A0A232LYW9_9EURO|nr:hypothetical protein Egran_02883 [Elaphomyces granulatus]